MPEYLSPGVYTEEVSFRSKSIEGVPTSTTGMAGLTRFGPVHYADGPLVKEPRLITSFTEFENVFGGLEELSLGAAEVTRLPYLAHAARAYFLNGGQRLYVSRVFAARPGDPTGGVASRTIAMPNATTATWRARWPGLMGRVKVETIAVRSKNIAFDAGGGLMQVRNVKAGAVVEIRPPPPAPQPKDGEKPVLGQLASVSYDPGTKLYSFADSAGAAVVPPAGSYIYLVELMVAVTSGAERRDAYVQLAAIKNPNQRRYIGRILEAGDPEDENAMVYLDFDASAPFGGGDAELARAGLHLTVALTSNASPFLEGGNDGAMPSPDELKGEVANPDDALEPATGLTALGEIDDIAIVAMPDAVTYDDDDSNFTAAQYLITHAEDLKYRIAVVDAPVGSSITQVREWRGKFDSKHAALYHPWVEVLDPLARPTQGAPPQKLMLPPSGFVTGIYARSDIERGVHKAPANEVVRGLTRFEANINKRRQDVLNPEGINALRFFEGRGNRVWGARTMSSDPEWKYVNVRRLFAYLEHSIDKGSQWAVFEPNSERLWSNVRETVSNFLYTLWKDGALLGTKPEEAYFVRCDRTTMTQNDIDNGRMIVLIGVAPVKPAEFVIFRVGQFTFNAKS